jgi:hypothetical protein
MKRHHHYIICFVLLLGLSSCGDGLDILVENNSYLYGLINNQTDFVLEPTLLDATLGFNQFSPSMQTTNYKSATRLVADRWTHSSQPTNKRGLIYFDISSIPSYATITYATISLYGANESTDNYWHMNFVTMGVGYEPNDSYLQRVISTWDIDTVTYDTQPSTTTTNQVSLTDSLTHGEDYPDIDITQLVQDMVDDPANSYGLMFRLQNEIAYTRMCFASTDHADTAKHPEIRIEYTTAP